MAWHSKYYDASGLEVGGVQLPARSWFGPAAKEDIEADLAGMRAAEAAGEFAGLFKGECRESRNLPTKEKLLSSINPDMKLYKSIFMQIYGYKISWPGFADQALTKLEEAGCSKAREYYQRFVDEYEEKHEKGIRAAAAWYAKELEKKWKEKGDEESRKRQEVEERKTDLQKKSDRELLSLLQKLKVENAL